MTGRFHRSVAGWKRQHPPAPSFTHRDGRLIVIIDGIWAIIDDVRYTIVMVLARRITGWKARLKGLVLIRGEECQALWEQALDSSLTAQELANVSGLVGDGGHGLTTLCREQGWVYQRCHTHLLRDLHLISGKRSPKTRAIRERALELVRGILNTPSERKAQTLAQWLQLLIARADCPKTVRNKVGGFLRHYAKYRACYQYPELRLPRTTNSAECVSSRIQYHINHMRGMKTERSLAYWLDILLRLYPTVRCSSRRTNQIKES